MDNQTKHYIKHLLAVNASLLRDAAALYTFISANLPNLTDEQRNDTLQEAQVRLNAAQQVEDAGKQL